MSPLVWGTEKMEVAWQYNVAHSGNTFIGGRWLCVDEATGNALAASTKTPLISGTVHGLIIFTLIIIRWLRANKPNPNLQ